MHLLTLYINHHINPYQSQYMKFLSTLKILGLCLAFADF